MRRKAKALRDNLSHAHRRAGAARIADIGVGFASPDPGAVIAAYSPIGSELDPLALLERLVMAGNTGCLPVLQGPGQPLKFRAWQPGDRLQRRLWGIGEPRAERPVQLPTVLLMPLLAFDAQGWRLGYGGGYYDRTLQLLRANGPVTAIGVAFSEQQVARLPHDANDQRLDWILTPMGSRQCRQHGD